jgi:hypothetical protein
MAAIFSSGVDADAVSSLAFAVRAAVAAVCESCSVDSQLETDSQVPNAVADVGLSK